MSRKMTNAERNNLARDICRWGQRKEILSDSRIYFNGKAWNYASGGKKTTLTDILPSEYFEYADDNYVCMTFEGPLYSILNYYTDSSYCNRMIEEFNNILDKHGVWYQLGNAWNCTLYPSD